MTSCSKYLLLWVWVWSLESAWYKVKNGFPEIVFLPPYTCMHTLNVKSWKNSVQCLSNGGILRNKNLGENLYKISINWEVWRFFLQGFKLLDFVVQKQKQASRDRCSSCSLWNLATDYLSAEIAETVGSIVFVVGAVCDSAEDSTQGLGHAREVLYSDIIYLSHSMSLMNQEISLNFVGYTDYTHTLPVNIPKGLVLCYFV